MSDGEVDVTPFQGLLVGQIIVAAVGALLLAIDDFAGFYYREAGADVYGYVYFGSGVLAGIFIGVAIAALLAALVIPVRILQKKYGTLAEVKAAAGTAMRAAAGAAGLALLGGIVFAIDSTIDDSDWWFDAGFYGALLGGLLAAFFAKKVRDGIEA